MTKYELFDAIKDMPEDSEIFYWCYGEKVYVGGADIVGNCIELNPVEGPIRDPKTCEHKDDNGEFTVFIVDGQYEQCMQCGLMGK